MRETENRIGKAEAPKCEHERTPGFYSDWKGDFVKKESVDSCPFCKPLPSDMGGVEELAKKTSCNILGEVTRLMDFLDDEKESFGFQSHEDVLKFTKDKILSALRTAKEQGRQEGLEEAAKIAEGFGDPNDNCTVANDINSHVDMISEAIRQAKQKGGGK